MNFIKSGMASLLVFAGLAIIASASAQEEANFRRPKDDAELRYWLENMVWHHNFTKAEIAAATGLTASEIDAALKKFNVSADTKPQRPTDAPLLVLPYPGGRHPRNGFLEGAIRPQRETKVSVFTPWDDGTYVVVDVPEAIFSNLGLTYLAHTHLPTIWEKQSLDLEKLEWSRRADGTLDVERRLPNGIVFGTRIVPGKTEVRMEIWLTNGTPEKLTDMRVQNCVLLKAAKGFDALSGENKVFLPPYAACKSADGRRWVITAWEPHQRSWGNAKCPCLHSDPRIPDCAPGETQRLYGWLSFYSGEDIQAELSRIEKTGWRCANRQASLPKNTPLAQLAVTMRAGEWAELKTVDLVETLRAKGASGAIFGYNEDAVWDPKTRQFYFVGGDHNDIVRFVIYVDDSNSWKIMPQPDWVGKGTSHGYSHHGFDSNRGLLYYFPFGNKARVIHRYDIAKAVWSTLPKLDPPEYLACCLGVEYFPELDGLVIANGGGGKGSVYLFQEKTQQWTTLARDLPMGIYHNTAQYSPAHKIVLFGGGNGSSDLYKLDAKGIVTTLKQTPIGLGVMQSILTVDPASGDFLLFGKNGDFYVYDALADAWKQQDRAPVPIFSPTRVKDNKVWHVTATPISTYGVTMFVKYHHADSPQAWVYLYKHQDSKP